MSQDVNTDISNKVKWSWLLLVILTVGAWFWAFSDAIFHMVKVWSDSEAYKHCFFVPLISAYLAYQKRHQLSFQQIRPALWLLLPIFALQIVYLIVAQLEINLFMHGAAVASLVLLLWTLIGNKNARILAFPLFYLLFAIPFGEELVPLLQQVTADLSVFFLEVVGIPVYREALYLYLPNGTFHVAEACAGVRFLIGTFTIGVLFSYINYTRYWKRVLFIIVCAVLPVIANGIRAFGIMVIGYYSDMKYATGADHLVYGWFFFAFILVLLFYLGSIFTDKPPEVRKPGNPARLNTIQFNLACSALLLGALLLPRFAANYVFTFSSDAMVEKPFRQFTLNPSITPISSPAWSAPTQDQVWFGQWQDVIFRVIYVNEQTQDKELVSSRHRLFDNERWTQSSIEVVTLDTHQVRVARVVNIAGEAKILVGWYQVSGLQSINTVE